MNKFSTGLHTIQQSQCISRGQGCDGEVADWWNSFQQRRQLVKVSSNRQKLQTSVATCLQHCYNNEHSVLRHFFGISRGWCCTIKISPVGDWRSTSLEWRFSILDPWIESDIPSSITNLCLHSNFVSNQIKFLEETFSSKFKVTWHKN